MELQNAPIGVFDSGYGGLTVVREIMCQIPNEKIIYFGDTARVPYGTKSRETILKYSKQIVRFLRTKEVKAIVVACNTASALALEDIRRELDIPIIGVIKPGAKVAANTTQNGKIGIIATEATINSRIYKHFIQDLNPELTVIGKACPLFVPIVEEGTFLDDPILDEIANRYLGEIKKQDIDTLILGCTHYPLLSHTLHRLMGEKVTLVNPAYETTRELKCLLHKQELENMHKQDIETMHTFYVSDAPERFKQFAASILPCSAERTMQINIEEY